MAWVRFTETQEVANAAKDIYVEGKAYDLAEASVQRWESMGVVERITETEAFILSGAHAIADAVRQVGEPAAAADEQAKEPIVTPSPVGTAYTVKVGKKFDVYIVTADGAQLKVNKSPLSDKDALALVEEKNNPEIVPSASREATSRLDEQGSSANGRTAAQDGNVNSEAGVKG